MGGENEGSGVGPWIEPIPCIMSSSVGCFQFHPRVYPPLFLNGCLSVNLHQELMVWFIAGDTPDTGIRQFHRVENLSSFFSTATRPAKLLIVGIATALVRLKELTAFCNCHLFKFAVLFFFDVKQ
ncbi:hypothetical protein BgiBS90_027607 [Biomphalaria glabrata]|nr:hypothetical protein BgiBS90_027607 [Biomphalaria glabrata]